MKRFYLIVFVMFSICLLIATPFTSLGSAIRTPNGYVVPHTQFTGTFAAYTRDNHGELETKMVGAVSGGLWDRIEVGVVYTDDCDGLTFANAKLKVFEETAKFPAVSFGMDNIGSAIGRDATKDDSDGDGEIDEDQYSSYARFFEKNAFYGVATKSTVIRGLPVFSYIETVASIGIGSEAKYQGVGDLSKDFSGLFASVLFRPNKWFGVIGEIDGSMVNAGIDVNYNDFAVRVALTELDEYFKGDSSYDKLNFTFALSYTFNDYVKENKQPRIAGSNTDAIRGTRVISNQDQLGETDDLLKELRAIRERRANAQKELEEIRKILEESE
ncbi:MAG: hypothetical protein P9L91_02080 [Candidatus Zophobacter franzmannii]|nr:hypothetical protein [Candidatus Zophobacter franzmannii]